MLKSFSDRNTEPKWPIMLCVIIAIACIPYYSFALTKLWAWFIVPLGLKPIGMAHAYGILLFSAYLKGIPEPVQKPEMTPLEKAVRSTIGIVLLPTISLGLGALVHSLM